MVLPVPAPTVRSGTHLFHEFVAFLAAVPVAQDPGSLAGLVGRCFICQNASDNAPGGSSSPTLAQDWDTDTWRYGVQKSTSLVTRNGTKSQPENKTDGRPIRNRSWSLSWNLYPCLVTFPMFYFSCGVGVLLWEIVAKPWKLISQQHFPPFLRAQELAALSIILLLFGLVFNRKVKKKYDQSCKKCDLGKVRPNFPTMQFLIGIKVMKSYGLEKDIDILLFMKVYRKGVTKALL